jgi:hypothetical protein
MRTPGGRPIANTRRSRPSFDSGKFHNHCVECPDFGTCLGDYREAHCMDCGKHWFAGMSGFACSHCGGGHGGGRKSKPLAELAPPPSTAFDGIIEGAADKIRAKLPSMNPLQRMMLQSLLATDEPPQRPAAEPSGPASTGGGRSRLTPEVDSSDVMMGMLAALAGGGEGLPPMPPELREQMAENPQAVMALMAALMGDGGGGGGDDDDDDDRPPPRKATSKASRKNGGPKKPRRGGSGGSGGGGGSASGDVSGISAAFAY